MLDDDGLDMVLWAFGFWLSLVTELVTELTLFDFRVAICNKKQEANAVF